MADEEDSETEESFDDTVGTSRTDGTSETETDFESTTGTATLSEKTESYSEEFFEVSSTNVLLAQEILSLNERHIRAEDYTWGLSPVPDLADIIVAASVKVEGPELDCLIQNATEEQKQNIFSLLPLDLSLKYTLKSVPDSIYWKRQCIEKWSENDSWQYMDNWKRMYVERSVEEFIESFLPGETEIIVLKNFLKIFQDFIHRLKLKKLMKAPERRLIVDLSSEDFDGSLDDFLYTPENSIYIDFNDTFQSIPNLENLSIMLETKTIDFEKLHFSTPDFNSFLRGLKHLSKLKQFRLSNGSLTNFQIIILCKLFLNFPHLTHLNLSYNFIDDSCCDYVGKLLLSTCPLQVLILKYNKITDTGATSIAAPLFMNSTLQNLDLSLNLIGNIGSCFLAKAISKNRSMAELDISKNKLGRNSVPAFIRLMEESTSLRSLKIQENYLGEDAGKEFMYAIEKNKTLLQLDTRLCGFHPDDEDALHQAIIRNRSFVTYPSYCFTDRNTVASEFVI